MFNVPDGSLEIKEGPCQNLYLEMEFRQKTKFKSTSSIA